MHKERFLNHGWQLFLIQAAALVLLLAHQASALLPLMVVSFALTFLAIIGAGMFIGQLFHHIPSSGSWRRKGAEFFFVMFLILLVATVSFTMSNYSLTLSYFMVLAAGGLAIEFAIYLYRRLIK